MDLINNLNGFEEPVWSDLHGANGAYVARSLDGITEAIAMPENGGFACWIVSASNGETIDYKFIKV